METVRGMIQALVGRSVGLLDQSQMVWQLWLDWELERQKTERYVVVHVSADGRDIERIHELYRDRLAVPHAGELRLYEAEYRYSSDIQCLFILLHKQCAARLRDPAGRRDRGFATCKADHVGRAAVREDEAGFGGCSGECGCEAT